LAEDESNWGWRHYWRENRLAACVPDNPNSAAAIETHWSGFFSELPAGKRVLDIATGNGVLLAWAARATRAAGRELTLTGIDLADIDPARYLPEHQIDLAATRFVGNTAAESLPFADGSFDVVVSQYGLEYADLELALSESARVLVSGGQLHWLAHGIDSIVVAQGRAQLVDIDLLLASDGPFAAMKTYIGARVRGRKVNDHGVPEDDPYGRCAVDLERADLERFNGFHRLGSHEGGARKSRDRRECQGQSCHASHFQTPVSSFTCSLVRQSVRQIARVGYGVKTRRGRVLPILRTRGRRARSS